MATMMWINANRTQSRTIEKYLGGEDQSETSETEHSRCLSSSSLHTDEKVDDVEVSQVQPMLGRAVSLKEKRQKLEAWNMKQKSEAVRTGTMEVMERNERDDQSSQRFTSSRGISPRKPTKFTKTEGARINRIIERLTYTEKQIKTKLRESPESKQSGGKRRSLAAIREKAELKLRLSQIEAARDFYQQRLVEKSSAPIPMEVLKVISSLPKYQSTRQPPLQDELNQFVRSLKEESPEQYTSMLQEMRKWKGKEKFALDLGMRAPDFHLRSNSGKLITSKVIRQNQRLILVFYHNGQSSMCKMNLMALEKLKKTYEREGAQLLGIGYEPDTSKTEAETGVTFPLIPDAKGSLARKFGVGGRGEPPMTSTFIIDTNRLILWKFVSADFTKRADPMDILEALPAPPVKKGWKWKLFGSFSY